MKPLFCYTTAHAAQLWWHRPAEAAPEQQYEVLLDGAVIAQRPKRTTASRH